MNEHDLSDAVTVKLLQEHCTITIYTQSVNVGRSMNEKDCVVCLNANNHAQKRLHTLTTGGGVGMPHGSALHSVKYYLKFFSHHVLNLSTSCYSTTLRNINGHIINFDLVFTMDIM